MTSRLRKLSKYLGGSVLRRASLASRLRRRPTATMEARSCGSSRGYGHGKHRGADRYHPRFVVREYYRQPYYMYQPHNVEPRIYGYGYLPRYPTGNLSLTLDFPFHF
jgi:hypothetical protein